MSLTDGKSQAWRHIMANEVFKKTQRTLVKMISERAANRVLRDVLKAQGVSPDTVTAERMATLLNGPILKELTGLLPTSGVTRSLNELALELRQLEARRQAGGRGGNVNWGSVAEFTNPKTPPVDPDLFITEDDDSPAPRTAAGEPASVATATKPRAKAVAKGSDPWLLTEAQAGDIVLRFAQLEHIRLVAAIRTDGTVVSSRGDGASLEDLARFGMLGLKLLGKVGNLQSFYLLHSLGQLFIFPSKVATLFIVGDTSLNVGAVLSTLTSLKEEL